MNKKINPNLIFISAYAILILKKGIWSGFVKNEGIRGKQIMGMKKKMFAGFCTMFVLISSFSPVLPQDLKGTVVRIVTKDGKKIPLYKKSYALLIGVWDYPEGWDRLSRENIENDIEIVDEALKKHDFITKKVINPTCKELKKQLDQFKDNWGLESDNHLLIYFSGHGFSRHDDEIGYIVPKDAPYPGTSENLKEFLRRSVSMERFVALAKEIESRHVLFVFDSCFSGTIFNPRKGSIPGYIKSNLAEPVRFCITAGKANQTVPGKSVFTPALSSGIKGNADTDNDGYVTGMELYLYIKKKVESRNNRHKPQNPQYGTIKVPGYKNEGDFVFILKKNSEPGPDELSKKRREKKVREFTSRLYEMEIREQNVPLYLKNREIKEEYQKIWNDFKPHFNDFRKDKELNRLINRLKKKIEYYSKQPDFVKILIRVYPYADVYINGKYLGEAPPQRVKEKVQEGIQHTIKLAKDKKTFPGEFIVKNGRVEWIKKIQDINLTLIVED